MKRNEEDLLIAKVAGRIVLYIGEVIGLVFGVLIGTWGGIALLAGVWLVLGILFTWWDLRHYL